MALFGNSAAPQPSMAMPNSYNNMGSGMATLISILLALH